MPTKSSFGKVISWINSATPKLVFNENWWNHGIKKVQFWFSIAVIVTYDNLILCKQWTQFNVLTWTCSDWCREENGRGPDPECVRTIRLLRRSLECHDISKPVPVRHSGKIGQRETSHTGRLRQPSDWSSGTHTDITPGINICNRRQSVQLFFLNSEVNFHHFQVWLSPIHGFCI